MPKHIDPSSARSGLTPWLVLMFLFSMNFMSAGGYLLLILMTGYTAVHLRGFSFRMPEIFLFFFGVEYFLFYYLWNDGAALREVCNYLAAPWLLYWIGRHMAYNSKQADLPLQMATVLALGFFLYGVLCIVYSISIAPPGAGARVMYQFWDRTVLSVTVGGLLFSMAIGVSIGQLTAKNTIPARLFWLTVLGICLFYAFTWAHRTSIYIIAILVLFNYLEFLCTKKTAPVRKLTLLLGSVLLVCTLVLCLMFNVGGCYSWLQNQWLFQRLTDPALANSANRFLIWRTFFEKWLRYPLGGKQFDITASFAHNMWLDVYYLCGALPFIALVIATVIIAGTFIRYRKLRISLHDHRCVHILANFYLAVFLAFMVEPVIQGYPYILLAVLLVSGSIDGTNQKAHQVRPLYP